MPFAWNTYAHINTFPLLIFTLHRATIASRCKKKKHAPNTASYNGIAVAKTPDMLEIQRKKKESEILFAYILISFDVVFCLQFTVLYNFSFAPTTRPLCIFNSLLSFCCNARAMPHTNFDKLQIFVCVIFLVFFSTIFILLFRS